MLRSNPSSDVAGPSYVSPHFGRSMVDPGTPADPLPGFVKAEQASSIKPAWNQQAFRTRAPGNLKQQLHAVGTQVDEAASITTSLAFRTRHLKPREVSVGILQPVQLSPEKLLSVPASRVDGDPKGGEGRQRRRVSAERGRDSGERLGVPQGSSDGCDLGVIKAPLGRLHVVGINEVEGIPDQVSHLFLAQLKEAWPCWRTWLAVCLPSAHDRFA
jgi:hypothetical protein